MALSDCAVCWETPCVCGHEYPKCLNNPCVCGYGYRKWSIDHLYEFKEMINKVIDEKAAKDNLLY